MVSKNNQGIIQTKPNIQKETFSYQLEDVMLEFTLRVDVKTQLKNFASLLERALMDVNKRSEELFSKR